MLEFGPFEGGAVDDHDDSQAPVQATNQERVGGDPQRAPDGSYLLGPGQGRHPVGLDVKVTTPS